MHNDVERLRELIEKDIVMVGYNNRGFDQYIIKAILCGENPKDISDYIVNGGQGWEYPGLQGVFLKVPPQIDLMQDTLQLSLKEIEGNIGWNIKETDVDFNLKRPLFEDEIELTIQYCKSDVKILPKLWEIRKDYIDAKATLCELGNISLEEGLTMTNAKLTAKFLNAKRTRLPGRREWDYSKIPNIDWKYIPLEVQEFFDKITDKTIDDEDFEESKLDMEINGVPHTIAWGGIHGALENFLLESNDDVVIQNWDVASLYPSIVLNFNYVSRAVPSAELYRKVYTDRLAAKKAGDKKTANALKLILNTKYGAMNNKYNDLYDPAYNLATCVTGQILLLELIYKLLEKISSIQLIQSNTDGIMFSIKRTDEELVSKIIHEWELQHNLGMELDVIDKVVQRDVNNYCIKMGSDYKYKGATMSDYAKKDSWKHHSLEICAEALLKKLLEDKPIEETIMNCNDLFKFQMITKTGRTYKTAVRLENGVYKELQRVNRVFAGKDPSKGAIFKFKNTKDKNGDNKPRYDKVSNCPLQTLVDGYDTFTIDDIDKQWYIDLTNKRYEEFLGGKNGKKKRSK